MLDLMKALYNFYQTNLNHMSCHTGKMQHFLPQVRFSNVIDQNPNSMYAKEPEPNN